MMELLSPTACLWLIPPRNLTELSPVCGPHDWYKQNPALDLLSADSVSHMAKNSLFVIGRNIYQAACGSANGAVEFVRNFMDQTSGYPHAKRKAILDGMLFEIFFNKEGKLRHRLKMGYFDEMFELQRFEEVKDSFDFIASALTAAGGDFYAVPGKGHEVSATIATKNKKDKVLVEAIYVDGADVLRKGEGWVADGESLYSRIEPEQLNSALSEELIVPARLLKISYTPPDSASAQELRIPMGWTARKIAVSDEE
jgi:hypothetical protein